MTSNTPISDVRYGFDINDRGGSIGYLRWFNSITHFKPRISWLKGMSLWGYVAMAETPTRQEEDAFLEYVEASLALED